MIRVSAAHIANGQKRDSKHCMIADAIKAAIPSAVRVDADIQTLRYSNARTDMRYIYLTPPAAQQAILAFDQGKTVRPFSFSLQAAVRVRKIDHRWSDKRPTDTATAAGRKRMKALKAKAQHMRKTQRSTYREFGLRALHL